MQPSFEDTIRFIQQAHEGQRDRAGQEYWKHPVQVAATVASLFRGTEDEKIAALLHDVVEDTPYDLPDLAELGYNRNVLDILWWVSSNKSRHGTYAEWIQAIAEQAPLGAVKVKLADNMSNMREGVTPSLARRYERSMAVLRTALDARG